MPDIRLPNGRLIQGVPEGTSKEEIKRRAIAAGLATEQDFTQAAPVQQAPTAPPQGRTQTAQSQVYSGLAMQGQGILQRGEERRAQMEQLRQINPVLAQEIESMSPLQAATIGAGQRVATMGRGLGLMEQADETSQINYNLLRSQRPSTVVGEFAGEAGMAAAPGSAIARVPGALVRAGAGAAYGTAEGMTMARGEGGSAEDMLVRGGITGVISGLTAGLFPGPQSAAQQRIANTLRQNEQSPVVDVISESLAGNPEDAFGQIVQAIDSAAEDELSHPIVQQVREAIESGATPQDVVATARSAIDDARNSLTDDVAANYVLAGANQIASDPAARTAIKQGFSEGAVAAVKGSSAADKSQMRRMLTILKRGRSNARYGAENRPTDIVGESLLQRFNRVRGINQRAGESLNQIARRDLAGKPVDLSPVRASFLDQLDANGITVTEDGLDFVGSSFEGLSGPQDAITNIYNRLMRDMDALGAHRTKRYIDELVNYGSGGEGLRGTAENMLKGVRRELNDSVRGISDDYARQNDIFSQTISALDDFQRAAGTSLNLASPSADKSLGVAARRLLSNTQSRGKMLDSLAELQRLGNLYSPQKFNDDIVTQIMFADELEKIFGTSAATSLQGEVAKGAASALRGRGLGETAVDIGVSAADRLRGITPENALQAMERLLRQEQ